METFQWKKQKESQFSQKVKYHKSQKLGKECHIKFYKPHISKTHDVNEILPI